MSIFKIIVSSLIIATNANNVIKSNRENMIVKMPLKLKTSTPGGQLTAG